MKTRADAREQVCEVIYQTLRNNGKTTADLDDDTPLSQIGLDSMEWAEFVVQMESVMGFDPFSRALDDELRTLRDLISLYEPAH